MDTPPTHDTPRPPRSLGKAAVRWGLIVLMGLGAALVIDLARQTLATDQVRWTEIDSFDQWTSAITPASDTADSAAPTNDIPKPRLIRFTADWCSPCLAMKSQVFSKASVADAIHERFEAYSVDLTQPNADQEALSQRYRVMYLPTLLMIDARGHEIARLDERVDAEAFTAWLERGYDQWTEERSATEDVLSDVVGLQRLPATQLSPVSHNEPIN